MPVNRDHQQRDPLSGNLVNDHLGGILATCFILVMVGGDGTKYDHQQGGDLKRNPGNRLARTKPVTRPNSEPQVPGAGCNRPTGPTVAREHHSAGVIRRSLNSRLAVACAAMPSPRPVKPSPSDVVALTPMRLIGRPLISAIRVRMASRYGVIFGVSQMIVRSRCRSSALCWPQRSTA